MILPLVVYIRYKKWKVIIINRDGEPNWFSVVLELDEEFEGFTGRTDGAQSSINLSYF